MLLILYIVIFKLYNICCLSRVRNLSFLILIQYGDYIVLFIGAASNRYYWCYYTNASTVYKTINNSNNTAISTTVNIYNATNANITTTANSGTSVTAALQLGLDLLNIQNRSSSLPVDGLITYNFTQLKMKQHFSLAVSRKH